MSPQLLTKHTTTAMLTVITSLSPLIHYVIVSFIVLFQKQVSQQLESGAPSLSVDNFTFISAVPWECYIIILDCNTSNLNFSSGTNTILYIYLLKIIVWHNMSLTGDCYTQSNEHAYRGSLCCIGLINMDNLLCQAMKQL